MESNNFASAWLSRAEQLARKALEVGMVISGLALAALMFTQVILRELDSAFLGFEEAAILLGLWVYFLGFAYSSWNRNQIAGGLETLLIRTERGKDWHRLFVGIGSLCFLAFITLRAWDYYVFTSGNGRVSTYLGWPRGLWASSLMVGMGISLIAQLIHVIAITIRIQKGTAHGA